MHRVKTQQILKNECLGTNPVSLQMLSDPQRTLNHDCVNYEDPHINISLPVFCIHGNHDDPAGDGVFSALDQLAVSSLVNYFGCNESVDDITVSPILLKKGTTKIALVCTNGCADFSH